MHSSYVSKSRVDVLTTCPSADTNSHSQRFRFTSRSRGSSETVTLPDRAVASRSIYSVLACSSEYEVTASFEAGGAQTAELLLNARLHIR